MRYHTDTETGAITEIEPGVMLVRPEVDGPCNLADCRRTHTYVMDGDDLPVFVRNQLDYFCQVEEEMDFEPYLIGARRLTGKKPDHFYRQFMWCVEHYVRLGIPWAEPIAAANDVPVTTVYRWRQEASRRNIGPASEPGDAVDADPSIPMLYTVEEAATLARRSANALRLMRSKGLGPRFRKIDGRLFVSADDLAEWLAGDTEQENAS